MIDRRNYPHIPADCLRELAMYAVGEHPYPFGDFLTAVLANDFVGLCGHADDVNRWALMEYASLLYNDLPGRTGDPERDFWGSYEAVHRRIAEQQQHLVAKQETDHA